MKGLYFLLLGILLSRPVIAQKDSATISHAIRRSFASYDEEIMYYGKRNQYFTVRIFQKNGTLFRLDSYTLLPKTLGNGIPLDSINRIVRHGPTKIMYLTGKVYISCEYKDNFLNGPFMVLYEDGGVKRREYYRYGRLAKSYCYTPDGTKQTCEPFYQAAQFLGNPNELSAYIKQKLGTVIDGERVRRITATLVINEIGQITKIGVVVNSDPPTSMQMLDVVGYTQQIIRNMPEWMPEKFNWKPAMNDGIAISSTCVLTAFRYNGLVQYNLSYRQ